MFKKIFNSYLSHPMLMSPSVSKATSDTKDCEELMRGGSKSFFAASRVLPSRVRTPSIALYAFCRLMDDIVDDGPEDENVITKLQSRIDAIYQGTPYDVPADRALAKVVKPCAIPQALLEALLEGFLWDKQGREYETLDDVYDYAARVAGTVGAMMALIMGVRSHQALARACELGLAMQLTNIARDVGEDARNGRLYLPRQWLREEGISPEAWLQNPQFTPALGRVIARLLKSADELYIRSQNGIAYLPRDCRCAIMAARKVYAEIGREVERRGYDSVNSRAIVSSGRKKRLIISSLSTAIFGGAQKEFEKMVPSIEYLVKTVPVEDRFAHYGGSLEQRVVWVINLLEKTELRRIADFETMASQKRSS